MAKIMARVKCYINVEEEIAEKKARDAKERAIGNSESPQYPCRSHYTTLVQDRATFKCNRKPSDNYKMGSHGDEPNKWCKYHKVKGHHTDDYNQVKREIKCLIQEGHLIKYV